MTDRIVVGTIAGVFGLIAGMAINTLLFTATLGRQEGGAVRRPIFKSEAGCPVEVPGDPFVTPPRMIEAVMASSFAT